MVYNRTKYLATEPEKIKEKLEKYGVVIIPDVLNDKEIDSMKENGWDFLKTITSSWDKPILIDDPSSWTQYSSKLYPKHSMLLQQWQIGHAQFLWDLRQNEKIIKIFSDLWNDEDLIVSFDGASFHFPHEVTGKGYYKNKNWLHCDQSFTRNDLECYQSWVNAYDTNEGDATLTFLEKSHLYHKKVSKKFDLDSKDDWYKLTEEQIEYYEKLGCKECQIKCSAGSLVIWDSRTIHAGRESLKDREEQNFRLVGYLCYLPRSRATEANLKKREKAFNEMRTTSHWPHKPKLFPEKPRTYGAELPEITKIPKPVLTKIGKKLI